MYLNKTTKNRKVAIYFNMLYNNNKFKIKGCYGMAIKKMDAKQYKQAISALVILLAITIVMAIMSESIAFVIVAAVVGAFFFIMCMFIICDILKALEEIAQNTKK